MTLFKTPSNAIILVLALFLFSGCENKREVVPEPSADSVLSSMVSPVIVLATDDSGWSGWFCTVVDKTGRVATLRSKTLSKLHKGDIIK
jgi:hypothetical protein